LRLLVEPRNRFLGQAGSANHVSGGNQVVDGNDRRRYHPAANARSGGRVTISENRVLLALGFAGYLAFLSSALWSQTDWPVYGHDPGAMRYSPLKQIDTKNAAKLQLAWKYDTLTETGAADPAAGKAAPRRNF